MRKEEQRLWDTMRRNLPRDVWAQRMENVMMNGMPDVVTLYNSFWVWTELKCADVPARGTTPLLGEKRGLSVDQRNWHFECERKGGVSYVLIRDDEMELYMISNKLCDRINKMTRNEMRNASLASDWNDVAQIIRGVW